MLLNKVNQQIVLVKTKYSRLYTVQLKLEHQTRYIGKIDITGDGTLITTRKEKHLFKKTNSLGINYELLIDSKIKFKWIIISYNKQKLISTRNYFLKKGKPFQFSNKGFELQIFVPINELNLNITQQFEQSLGVQQDLFSHVA